MPGNDHFLDQNDPESKTEKNVPSENARTTREQLSRIAELVANGEMSAPNGLSSDDLGRLEERIRDLRRQRLIGFFVRQIALTIHRDRIARKEFCHDQA